MQREEEISIIKLKDILDAVFHGSPHIYQEYSKYDTELASFSSRNELDCYIENEKASGIKLISLAIHYPETMGYIYAKKFALKSEKCDGATMRFSQEGWGLIHLFISFRSEDMVRCRFSVNSEKRANNWVITSPELKSPDLWNWKAVENNARRLIRVLRKCAEQD